MFVQTIPAIKDMTPVQRVELMEELWMAMSKQPEVYEVPKRHRRILEERRAAVERGETEYIDWEETKAYIRRRTMNRAKCNRLLETETSPVSRA